MYKPTKVDMPYNLTKHPKCTQKTLLYNMITYFEG